jgi:hypothetical protein
MDYVMHLDDGVEIFKGEEFADKACCPTLKEEVCGKHDEEEAKHVEVIEEEEMEVGRVQFSVYREMFSYGYGGEWGIAILVLISVIINFSTTSVSLYLAFTLAHKFKDSDEQQGHNNLTLLVIIILCLFFSFVGKFASNKIFMRVSLMLHKDITEKLVQTDLKFSEFFEENPHREPPRAHRKPLLKRHRHPRLNNLPLPRDARLQRQMHLFRGSCVVCVPMDTDYCSGVGLLFEPLKDD